MDQYHIEVLASGDIAKSKEILQRFVTQHTDTFDFTAIYSQWTTIWNGIFKFLRMPCERRAEALHIYPDCLAAIRILSRDKTHLNQTITVEQFDTLLNIANIGGHNENISDSAIVVEALKCLCNLVFQSTSCQMMCLKNAAIDGIVRRLRTYKDANVPYDLQYFDMKLLFLITALNPDVRTKVRDDYHGLTYLVEILDLIIKERSDPNAQHNELSDSQVNLLVEIMKVLFNITVRNETSVATEEEEEIQFRRLAVVLHDLLLCRATTKEKQLELCSNTINLLTNVPTACYSELVIPMHLDSDSSTTSFASVTNLSGIHLFEGHDVTALEILLEFLKCRLENMQELLSPVLTALVKCARCNKLQRQYLRQQVLPPLRDVKTRPEVGEHLRNRLVKLLTTPATQVRDLVADFLFVLCKENVGRMIKYTGYGNAAGLFANRGLVPVRSGSSYSGEYSSNSEDSDTEEYKQMQHSINPVVGCYEPPRPNPLEGMSEEQKEYEAMKLVNLMDQLNRQGLVQPCKIGEDGRPQAVEHILELQDSIPQQQMDQSHET
ncbi:synembryn isoform X2 [Contarinia nasturtii]|uniref:synembryn isoform X2 n=1 Tax=Contarinia nasturtii TaxID=265458 RepID=UPI0012D4736C|nr:synembryn isoform X2 [Contarinia nasturtii]